MYIIYIYVYIIYHLCPGCCDSITIPHTNQEYSRIWLWLTCCVEARHGFMGKCYRKPMAFVTPTFLGPKKTLSMFFLTNTVIQKHVVFWPSNWTRA